MTPPCGHLIQTGNYTWVCINPPHAWESESGPHVAKHRKKAGNPQKPDQHYYVAVPRKDEPS